MGLDVYLYHAMEDLEPWFEKCKQYEEVSKKNWDAAGEYSKLTQAQKDKVSAKNKKVADSLGLDEWGSIPDDIQEKVEMPSDKHGEHLYSIGYFRSSYNGGGTNSQCDKLGVPNLYDIFAEYAGDDGDSYYRFVDWDAAKEVVVNVITQLKEIQATDRGKFQAIDIEVLYNEMIQEGSGKVPNPDKTEAWYQEKIARPLEFKDHIPQSSPGAMDMFIKQLDEHKNKDGTLSGFNSYSSKQGHFHLNGLKCFGFIPGVKKHWSGSMVPTMYIIIESDSVDYILSCMEIVEETIDYVLAESDSDTYFLGWSG